MRPDLSQLPKEVLASARIDANGEVSWPDNEASTAIDALAAAGLMVLGLDIRFYDADGRFYEVAWTSFEPDAEKPTALNAEEARLAALEAVDRVDELDVPEDTVERRVLVAWQ
jgi:hypothetical protein